MKKYAKITLHLYILQEFQYGKDVFQTTTIRDSVVTRHKYYFKLAVVTQSGMKPQVLGSSPSGCTKKIVSQIHINLKIKMGQEVIIVITNLIIILDGICGFESLPHHECSQILLVGRDLLNATKYVRLVLSERIGLRWRSKKRCIQDAQLRLAASVGTYSNIYLFKSIVLDS